MAKKAERERKNTEDAIKCARKILLDGTSLSILQRKQVDVLTRQAYYLGLMDGMKEYYAIHNSLKEKEHEDNIHRLTEPR